MFFINWLKVLVVWLADTINRLYDPFEYNHDLAPVDTLENLDKKFAAELDAEFMMPSGEFLYQHPRPNDAGDTAIWHGVCCGMRILRGDDVSQQFKFLRSLFINGALIRGYWEGTNEPNDTTSNDSATGPLFAFYCALRFGNETLKSEVEAILLPWAENLKKNNWALANLKGQPTKFGQLENGIMTDPLRITLLLAILSLASAYDSKYLVDYNKLYDKYKPILAYPKVKLLWLDTSYDTHRAAIALHVLYWMTKDKVYKKGLQRLWRISGKTNNVWVYTLCAEALDKEETGLIDSVLQTFDYKKRQLGNMESLNNDWPSVKWGDKLRAKKALPINRRGSQDFFWQRHPFSLSENVGNIIPGCYHSGLDFLVCLNLAKRLNVL